jgi:hypothetical protein
MLGEESFGNRNSDVVSARPGDPVQMRTALSACRHSGQLVFLQLNRNNIGTHGLSGNAAFGELHAIHQSGVASGAG